MVSKSVQESLAVIVVIAACTVAAVTFNLGLENLYDSDQYARITLDGDSGVDSFKGAGLYYADTEITVRANLKDGYQFDAWYNNDGDRISSANPYTFVLDKDLELSARTIAGDEVKVYHMNGISKVLKTSENQADNTITIRAVPETGTHFTGWYNFSGELLSASATLTIDKKYQNSVVAKTDSTEYTGTEKFSYTLSYQMEVDSVIWIITDWRTGEFVQSFTKVSSIDTTVYPGKYDLRVVGTRTTGQSVDGTQHVVIEGEVKKTFTWKFEGQTHSAVWTTDYKQYNSYQNSNVNRAPTTYNSRMEFINYTSNTVTIFGNYLKEHSTDMTDLQRANYVLAFVQQCIEYQLDSDFCGKSEYWKYPYETLYDGRGDCEDSSILFCALMKSMGYDSALILYVGEEYVGKGHAAAGVAFDSVPGGTYYNKNGKHYYFCETTGAGYEVGEKIEGYDTAYVYVV